MMNNSTQEENRKLLVWAIYQLNYLGEIPEKMADTLLANIKIHSGEWSHREASDV